MRFVVLVLAAVLLAGCAAVSAGDPTVAAKVGDEEIPIDKVEDAYEQARENPEFVQRLEQEPQFGEQVQAQILTALIQGEILEDWADELNLDATQAEIDEERKAVIEQLGGEEAFDEAVKQNGLTPEQVDEQLRQRVLQNKIAEKVEGEPVSDEEIEQFYAENRESRFGGTATARHILVKDRATAMRLRRRLEAGEDFAKLARQFSTDTGSAQQGGRLPAYARGQTAPEFEEALFSAPIGQLVGPVKTQFGYHLIEVINRSEPRPLSAVEDEIREELQASKDNEALQTQLRERTQKMTIEVNPRFGKWNAETGEVQAVGALGATTEVPSPGGGGSELPTEPLVIPTPAG